MALTVKTSLIYKIMALFVSLPLALFGLFFAFVIYKSSEDHSEIKEIVSSHKLLELNFEYCYENKCCLLYTSDAADD